MFNVNGPGFQGLYSGDTVAFIASPRTVRREYKTARVLQLLVFYDHVQVAYGPYGYTAVDASNFVRLVRRGKRHIAADKARGAEIVAALETDGYSPEDAARAFGPHDPRAKGAK